MGDIEASRPAGKDGTGDGGRTAIGAVAAEPGATGRVMARHHHHGLIDIGREWAPGEKRESKVVFIGRELDEETIRKGFLACAA